MDAEENIGRLEASVAWKLLQFASRLGMLWLPRKILKLLRGGSVGETPARPSTGETLATPIPFNVPGDEISEDFKRLLRRRPDSFGKVFGAPSLMTPQERVLLYALTFALAPRRYLEIGSCLGGSAMVVCAALDDLNGGKAWGVDPVNKIAPATLAAIGSRFKLIEGPSPGALAEAAQAADGRFDLVLVDGDHSYEAALADLEGVLPFVEDGGVIVVHDAHNPAVAEAIAAFLTSRADAVVDMGLLAAAVNRVLNGGVLEDWSGIRALRRKGLGSTAFRGCGVRDAQARKPVPPGANNG
jgi:predicted O-methyltransferase YrrM